MEEKYSKLYKSLITETKDTLENKNSNQYIEDFKASVKNRIKEIHEKLDAKKEEIIKVAIEAYSKDLDEISEERKKEKEEREKKKLEKQKESIAKKDSKKVKKKEEEKKEEKKVVEEVVKEEEPKELTFKDKINDVVSNIDSVLNKTEILEETINVFKKNKLTDVVEIKDNDFYFKHMRKLKVRLLGKVDFGAGWLDPQNKPSYCSTNKEDSMRLDVHASSCYNMYQTDKKITNEHVVITFETNITSKTDSHFYFGVINENVAPDNNCMCCTIDNAVYLKSTGYLIDNAKQETISDHNYSKGGDMVTITVRVDAIDKKCWFIVNDGEELGPYDLKGTEWTITGGSCSTANGYIDILSSLVLG